MRAHASVCVMVAIGVGDNLQEDVHLLENGRESRIPAVVVDDLKTTPRLKLFFFF